MNSEHPDPKTSCQTEESYPEQNPTSPNDDPTVVYSRAWWIANGIAPEQIMRKKEPTR